MKPTIYTLKLHEVLTIDLNVEVLRVPNGWIYSNRKYGTSVFVKYSVEVE